MADRHGSLDVAGQVESLAHDEGDGTYSLSTAAHMRIWNGSSWARWDGTLTTSAVHIGLVDQGAAGATPWPVSLAAETTKVIGTVNQGTSPWVRVRFRRLPC
jgi:hypothetical protein